MVYYTFSGGRGSVTYSHSTLPSNVLTPTRLQSVISHPSRTFLPKVKPIQSSFYWEMKDLSQR